MSNEQQPPIEIKEGEPIPFDLMLSVSRLISYVKVQKAPIGTDFEASWNQMIHKIAKELNYTVDTVKMAYVSVFNEQMGIKFNAPPLSEIKDPIYKKHHKPNTGFKLGSYKYKSR